MRGAGAGGRAAAGRVPCGGLVWAPWASSPRRTLGRCPSTALVPEGPSHNPGHHRLPPRARLWHLLLSIKLRKLQKFGKRAQEASYYQFPVALSSSLAWGGSKVAPVPATGEEQRDTFALGRQVAACPTCWTAFGRSLTRAVLPCNGLASSPVL